jgi:adenine C2-methylase RlmN of 23S rRNA A2503 and tRNA A37
MDTEKLEAFLRKHDQPKFRLQQIQKAIFQDGVSSFSEISTLSKDLRGLLEKEMKILSFDAEKVLVSKDGKSMKALLKLQDGNLIEAVLISPMDGTWSVCVSSQVGCPLGCGFCSTGKMGFIRNLAAEEITDQILFWKQYLRNFKFQISNLKSNPNDKIEINKNLKFKIKNYDVSNIVYMGMGEPFLNWKEVSQSLRILTDEKLFGFGSRSISVSTSGIPEGIGRMAEEFPQINLALSLHFGTDEKRNRVMPINRKNNLEALRQALKKYFQASKRKVFLEYVMLSGVNDSMEDADSLIRFVKSIEKLQLLHVNLIRYNSTGQQFRSSSKEHTVKFKNYLVSHNLGVTIRKSLGEEIQGACGQLATK